MVTNTVIVGQNDDILQPGSRESPHQEAVKLGRAMTWPMFRWLLSQDLVFSFIPFFSLWNWQSLFTHQGNTKNNTLENNKE